MPWPEAEVGGVANPTGPSPGPEYTYAEALYAAGRYREAVEMEQKALAADPDNAYFRKQLQKFKRALEALKGER